MPGWTWPSEAIVDPIGTMLGGDSPGLSLDVDTLALGCPGTASFDGSVDIFVRSETNTWTLQQTLTPPVSGQAGRFGASVSVSNNRLAVGEYAFNSGAGRFHVYLRTGVTWSLECSVPAPVVGTYNFGYIVSLDDTNNRCAVSTYAEDSYGAVRTYTRSGAVWSVEQKIARSIVHFFGRDLQLSGTLLAVSNATQMEVYRYAGGTWASEASWMSAEGGGGGANSIFHCAADGNCVAWIDTYPTPQLVQIYERINGSWSNTATFSIDNKDSDNTVAVDDTTGLVVVGDTLNNTGYAGAGAAHIYERIGGVWSECANSPFYGGHAGTSHALGYKVDVHGTYVAARDFNATASNIRVSVWGGLTPPSIAKISDIFVIAHDVVLVLFSSVIAKDDAYRAVASYQVTNLSNSDEAVILDVLPTYDDSASDLLFLRMANLVNNNQYEITIIDRILSDVSGYKVPEISIKWTMHRTKVDSALAAIPDLYQKRIGSNIRALIEAIMISDEKIGGDY